ncbi:MAG TPA: hypothetical protein VFB34_02705 [Chloroflexota bacterium]|nr:hypothetical protein [Chloroflexota bacterium]
MRFIVALVLGGLIGFGAALWFQGEPPFAGKPTGHGDITLILSDSYLTSQAGSAIAGQSNGTVSNVAVTSAAGDIVFVEARGTISGVSAPVGISVRPIASNGSIALAVKSAHLGPLPLPGVVTAPLVQTINGRISALTSGSSYRVTGAGTTSSGVEVFLTAS